MSQYPDNPNAYDASYVEPENKPKGCMFYGCLIVGIGFVLLLLLMIGGGVGGYFLLKGQVEKYTATEPVEIPVSDATEEQIAEVQQRVELLQQAVENDQPAAEDEVVLTADDINALIAGDDELRGKVFVRIDNGVITGEISIPLDDLPMGQGRFLNGSATFDVSYENGVPVVTLKEANVKGQPLPQQFVDAFKDQNLAKDMLKDPETAEKLRKFDSIRVEGDKIILRLKGAEADGAAQVDSPELPLDELLPPETE